MSWMGFLLWNLRTWVQLIDLGWVLAYFVIYSKIKGRYAYMVGEVPVDSEVSVVTPR